MISPRSVDGGFYIPMKKPIVLCGPTASGKTELALALARRTDGIVISADSRQVYTQLTIGTAKPLGAWKNQTYYVEGVPYYLVDFLNVTDTFNAGAFCARVREIVRENPSKQLIFAGGTGMYLHAYFVGMDALPAGTPSTRARLNQLLADEGKEGLHHALLKCDPESAAVIPVGNIQRTMRALELFYLTGTPASVLKSGRFFRLPDEENSHWVYLNWEKSVLQLRISARTEQMFDGMCEETRTLLQKGSPKEIPALKSLGYPQMIAFLEGTLSREETISQIVLKTRQYAKRQRTWFNRYTKAQQIVLQKPADFDTEKLVSSVLSAF